MKTKTLRDVADFYSERAQFPLRTLDSGRMVVAGSNDCYPDASRPRKRNVALWMGVLEDRAVIVTQPELVPAVQGRLEQIPSPANLMGPEFRDDLAALCRKRAKTDAALEMYLGRKFYCDSEMLIHVADSNVRQLDSENAGQAIRCLGSADIPDDLDYLLAEGTAFAYFLDGLPVAFAGTHPAGPLADRIGDIMVGTLEAHRRSGFGKAVISATTSAIISRGKVAVWGMSYDNFAAMKTAASIGYRQYCEVIELRYCD
jgi:hypothetical protein